MSAAAPIPRQKSHVVTDVDLRRLGVRGLALQVALFAREEAARQGTLQPAIPNERIVAALGVHLRSLQRAKRRLHDAGVTLIERHSRYVGPRGSENLADRYQLDRRRIVELRAPDGPPALQLVPGGGGDSSTPQEEVKPPHHHQPSADGGGEEGRGQPPPPPGAAPSQATTDGATAAAAPLSASVPLPSPAGVLHRPTAPGAGRPGLPVGAQLEPAYSTMRSWLAEASRAALDGERTAAALLDEACAHAVAEGCSRFQAALARKLLRHELDVGLGQLSIEASGGVPRTGERSNVNVADNCGSDEGTAHAPLDGW